MIKKLMDSTMSQLQALGQQNSHSPAFRSYLSKLKDAFEAAAKSKTFSYQNDQAALKRILGRTSPVPKKAWENFLWLKLHKRISSKKPNIIVQRNTTDPHKGICEAQGEESTKSLKSLPDELDQKLIQDFSRLLSFFSNGLLVQEYFKDIEKLYADSLSRSCNGLTESLEGRLLLFKSLAISLLRKQNLNQLVLPGVPLEEAGVMLNIYGAIDTTCYRDVLTGQFENLARQDFFLSHMERSPINIAFTPCFPGIPPLSHQGSLAHLVSFMAIVLALKEGTLSLHNSLDFIVRCALETEWICDALGQRGGVWNQFMSYIKRHKLHACSWPKGIVLNHIENMPIELSNRKSYPNMSHLQTSLDEFFKDEKVVMKVGDHLRPLVTNAVAYEFIPPIEKLTGMSIFEAQAWQRGQHLYSSIEVSHRNESAKILYLSESTPLGCQGAEILKKHFSTVIEIYWSQKDGDDAKQIALKKIRETNWDRLIGWNADLVMPEDILQKGVCENFHPAPRNARGYGFIERALLYPENFSRETYGESKPRYGSTYHLMIKEVDAGRILAEHSFEYDPQWDHTTLKKFSDQYMLAMLNDWANHTKFLKHPLDSEFLNCCQLSWSGTAMKKKEINEKVKNFPELLQIKLGHKKEVA